MLELFDYADSLGLSVEYAPLRARNGEYRDDLMRIRLHDDMTPRLTVWTLAHEIAHHIYRDVPSMFDAENARQERRADEWAALHLVDPKRYREAEALHEGHVPSIAHDLGVANRCIEVFRGCLERLDQDVYVAPQMGLGQYSARLRA